MKRKALALILCLAVIITVALPGTLAVSMDQETTTTTLTVGAKSKTDPQPTTEPPAPEKTDETTENGTPDPSTPETTVPETTVPETTVPETTVPETTIPETSAPQCTCATTDGNHAEGCELYVKPEEAEPFDPQQAYDQLMACETYQQMDEIMDQFTDEQWAQFTEEMIKSFFSHYVSLLPPDPNARVYGDHAPAFSGAGPLIRNASSTTRARMATYARSLARDADSTSGGLQLKKTAKVNTDNTYTITLEAFATGQSITTYVKEGVDIILMLDLSDYMNGRTTYSQVSSLTYSQLYQNIQNGQTYYAMDGTEYKQVTVSSQDFGTYWGTLYAISYSDNSGTLAQYAQGSDTVSVTLYQVNTTNDNAKLEALKSAVTTFIDNVHEQAPSSRIAIVPFADIATVESGTKNATEGALVYVDDSGQTALNAIVNNLIVRGGSSNSHYAAQNAVKIFQDVDPTSAEYNRQRVAILFSAGVSGTGWGTTTAQKQLYTSGQSVGQATMTLAYILKSQRGQTLTAPVGNMDSGRSWSAFISAGYFTDTVYTGCGATMYCVGLDIPTSGNPANVDMHDEPYKSGALANEYFWRTSSHRQNGTHIWPENNNFNNYEEALRDAFGENGVTVYRNRYNGLTYSSLYFFYPDSLTRNQNNGYYLTTTSDTQGGLSQLTAFFKDIADQATTNTSSSTTLGTSAVVKDIIAPEFKLPEGATASDITVESYDFNGMNGTEYTFKTTKNNLTATPTISGDGTVSVTGFDFSANWCGTDTNNGRPSNHGSKLVISFNVVTKPGFLGGNNVYTNTSAGVYADSNATTPVQEFERPQVNVQIPNITVNPAEKNVYLLGFLTGDQIKSGATASCGANLNLDPSVTNYGLQEWQNAYVNITVSYQDANGNTVTALSDLKDDTTYKVLVTVTPKEDAKTTSSGTAAAAKTGEGTGTINVFKPTLTFKDSTVYYGDTAPTDFSGNLTETEWKHNGTLDTTVTMTGDKPTLSLTYAPGAGIVDGKVATKNDIPVDVTVKIGTTDVTGNTTFVHTKCNANESDPADGKFWLHVKTCSLTITKAAGTNTTIGDDEYFVFNIKKDGEAYTQVTIQGTGSVTISELPVGNYTVEEDTATAWRYSEKSITGSGNLTSSSPTGSFTCTNGNKDNKWLNHFAQVINTFGVTKQN